MSHPWWNSGSLPSAGAEAQEKQRGDAGSGVLLGGGAGKPLREDICCCRAATTQAVCSSARSVLTVHTGNAFYINHGEAAHESGSVLQIRCNSCSRERRVREKIGGLLDKAIEKAPERGEDGEML